MNKERLNTYDIAKGIGIILVVLGHTATHIGLEKVIYQFHMPLFFILSGIFFKENDVQFPQAFIINKVRRLYVPYALNGLGLFFIYLFIY
jgi:acyltransferase